jgi:hypothetical protein
LFERRRRSSWAEDRVVRKTEVSISDAETDDEGMPTWYDDGMDVHGKSEAKDVFFDETGGEAPTDYIFNYKSNQKQYRGSRNKKSKVKNQKYYT